MRVCSVHGCGEIYPKGEGTRCRTHRAMADRARGTSTERGYTSAAHREFRRQVIQRDLICQLCGLEPATVADHYPRSRKELIELGLDPNDPQYGRGLGHRCHSIETAQNQPGGWNAR